MSPTNRRSNRRSLMGKQTIMFSNPNFLAQSFTNVLFHNFENVRNKY